MSIQWSTEKLKQWRGEIERENTLLECEVRLQFFLFLDNYFPAIQNYYLYLFETRIFHKTLKIGFEEMEYCRRHLSNGCLSVLKRF